MGNEDNDVPLKEPVVLQAPPPLDYYRPNRAMPAGSYWREGMAIRATDGAVLPHRCVKCNLADGVVMQTKKFNWFPRWTLVLLLVNLLVFAIVAMCMQKKATVTFGLCAEHRRRKAIGLMVCILLLLCGIGSFVVAGAYSNGYYVLVGFILLVASIVTAMVWASSLRCTTIREGVIWVKGAGADFLTSLDAPPAFQIQRPLR